ncbi:RCC1 domain-containing protein [Paenibacillus sp. strain BS8-2]
MYSRLSRKARWPKWLLSFMLIFSLLPWSASSESTVSAALVENVYAFGMGADGRLGLGEDSVGDQLSPAVIAGLSGISVEAVSAGINYSLVLTEDGDVYSFGSGANGRLGHGDTANRAVPTKIAALDGENVVAIAAGTGSYSQSQAAHSLALTSDGKVFAFGTGFGGQLGLGSTSNMLIPTEITGIAGDPEFVAIAAGGLHSLLLTDDGRVYSFGIGSSGQLGHGDGLNYQVPTLIASLTDVIAISAGFNFSLALKTDGSVYAFGAGTDGQLGLGTVTNHWLPTLITGLANVTAISAGYAYSLVLTDAEDVYAFGNNYGGRLGQGNDTNSAIPVQVPMPGGQNIKAISAGEHSLVLTEDQHVYAFGSGFQGQLGNGTQHNRMSPYAVSLVSGVKAISAGFYHSILIGAVDDGLTYSINLSEETPSVFYPLLQGYSTSLAKTVTITNTGTGPVHGLSAAISGSDASSFEFVGATPSPALEVGAASNFYVRPVLGLTAGEYEATVTVTANNGISQSFDVSATVTATPTYTIDVSQVGAHTFPALQEGYAQPAAHNITVARTGTGEIRNMAITLEGDDSDSFVFGSFAPGEMYLNDSIRSIVFPVRPVNGLTLGTYTATVRITGDNGVDESFDVSVTVNAPPRITDQPDDVVANEGYSATFSAAAEGTGTLTYQWQEDSGSGFVNMAGEESATLVLASTSPSMNGNLYRVVVTGALQPAAISSAAELTINPIPAVPAITSVIASDSQISLNWNPVSDTTGYHVYYGTASGVYGAPITVGASVYRYDLANLTNGTVYYIAVSALNGVLESAVSSEVQATPQVAAPGAPIIQSVVAGNASVELAWDEVDGATGYTVYQSTDSAIVGAEAATVTGSVYSHQVTGLTNGTTYYFVVTATNPGGVSGSSNQVSATPFTVPGAPTNVTAVAGNGQATVSFEPPLDNGGHAITGYEVRSTPGGIVASGGNSPILVTGLTNGESYTFTVRAINGAGHSDASTDSNAVVPYAPPIIVDTDSGSTEPEDDNTIDIWVNGVSQSIGKVLLTEKDGKQSIVLSVDEQKLEAWLKQEGKGAKVTIPVMLQSDEVIVEMNGIIAALLVDTDATVVIQTKLGSYTLPVSALGLDDLLKDIGDLDELADLKLQIVLAAPNEEQLKAMELAADNGFFTLLGPALHYSVRVTHKGAEYELSAFDAYVERTIVLPREVNARRITTAVVVNEDGTVRHVPTRIVRIDGVLQIVINSRSNSLYAVVSYPAKYEDISGHWADKDVRDIGSRLVEFGSSSANYQPEDGISRAEFAAIVISALGLSLDESGKAFTDVTASHPYADYIATAHAYSLLNGYEDGTFHPEDTITREEAMSVIARAMVLAELDLTLDDAQAEAVLSAFEDAPSISAWALDSVAANLLAGIVNGRSELMLAPKDALTRAEAAVIVRRLLQQANLIE